MSASRSRLRSLPTARLLAASVAFALSTGALAQALPPPSPDGADQLDQIVVTAAGFEQKIVDAPASISVVTREELRTRPYMNLLDALRDVEGIDTQMESTDKNGKGTISMRGMPSDYTLVMIDGRRQSNVGDLYPNNFGGGQFSFLPPLEAIDRIEVVRGPMSTLYGSDAMGGVVNIITRKIQDRWIGSLSHGRNVQEADEFGNSHTTDIYASGPFADKRWGLALRGSRYSQQGSNPDWDPIPLPDGTLWERTLGFGAGGREVAGESWNAGVRLAFMPNDNHDFWIDADMSRQKHDNTEGQTGTLDGIDSLWRSGNATVDNPNYDPSLPTGPDNPLTVTRRVVQPRVGYTEYQRYERDQIAFSHVGRFDFGTWQSSIMHNTSNNLGRSLPLTIAERTDLQTLWNDVCERRGQADYCNNGTGFAGIDSSALTAEELARLNAFLPRALRVLELENIVVDTRLDMGFGAHQFSVGGQWHDAEMEDGTFGLVDGGYVAGQTQPHRQWAVFAEDNWSLTDSLVFTVGARYDHHNIFGSQVTPRGYLVWTANDAWTFKGGVSSGYKTPKPNQLFPGITGFGGQGVSPFVGSPDLQPETSTNTELAAYYDGGNGFSANLTVFMNRFKDKIATGNAIPNCEVAPAGADCVDIGPGWADLGYRTFSQSTNIDRAETQGAEFAARWDISDAFTLRGNYTFVESEQKSGAGIGEPIAGNPAEHMLNATFDWRISSTVSMYLAAEARYDRYNDTLVNTIDGSRTTLYYKDYELFHLGASWEANEWLRFNARINNLLDEDFISQTCLLAETQDAYTCVDDYLVKDKRRSLWLSANVRF